MGRREAPALARNLAPFPPLLSPSRLNTEGDLWVQLPAGDDLWTALSAAPDGPALAAASAGELGVSSNRGGRMDRRVAPRGRVATERRRAYIRADYIQVPVSVSSVLVGSLAYIT